MKYSVQGHELTIKDDVKAIFEKERGEFNDVEQEITLLEAFCFEPIEKIFEKYTKEEIASKIEETILLVHEEMQ